VCLGFCLSLGSRAMAQEGPPILEELFRSEIVYPQEAGEVQLTFAPEFGRSPGRPVMASLSVEYGLTDAWQIGCGWQGALGGQGVPPGAAAESELEFSVKRSFIHINHSSASLALGLEVARAAEDSTAGGSSYEYRPVAVFAKDFPRWNAQVFALGSVNLSLLRETENEPGPGPGNDDKTEWAMGGFVKLGPVVLTQELNWLTSGWNPFSPDRQVFWTPGVVWKPPSERVWELGFGASVGLSARADPLRLHVTLTHEFETAPLVGH
jgi:hypothetical protein